MADPTIVAILIIAIIATIVMVISVILMAVEGNRADDNKSRQQTLWAASAFAGISILFTVITMIMGMYMVRRGKAGKKSKGLNITFIVLASLLFVMVLIALIISFVVGNQLSSEDNSEGARNLRAAGALLLIGIVLYGVVFVIVLAKYKALKGKFKAK